MIINAYIGESRHGRGSNYRRFQPTGRMYYCKGGRSCGAAERPPMENPVEDFSSKNYAGRLFVGLSVGQEPKYSIDDLIALVAELRKEQGHNPDASIIAQHGMFTGRDGKLVVEKSAQVIILDFEGLSKPTFVKEMQSLAETVCQRMEQELVILEIQRRGVVVATYGITP